MLAAGKEELLRGGVGGPGSWELSAGLGVAGREAKLASLAPRRELPIELIGQVLSGSRRAGWMGLGGQAGGE